MFGIEKDFQNLMEQVYGPLGKKEQMTEIEEVKAQIKVLEKKLSFLEELEKTKSPVEEAFKDWMGVYPPTNPSVDNIFDIRWRAFQKGYAAAYEEKVSEWQPTPQEPEQVADGLKEAFREAVNQGIIHEVDKVSDVFMNEMVAELKGETLYDICMTWWERVFDNNDDMETCIDDLVDRIGEFLPKEHDTNSYKWNECIRTIKSKLR